MNQKLDLTNEFELLSIGGEMIQVVTPGIGELVSVYPEIGFCLNVTNSPWRPLDIPVGKMIVETYADQKTIAKIKANTQFELIWPPETIIDKLDLMQVLRRIAIGKVKAGEVYLCYDGNCQFTILNVADQVEFELDITEGFNIPTRVYAFPVFKV